MKVAMVVPPYRYGADPRQWITVPPQGYGGIQWVVATLMDGLLEAGCEILLLGAPGSPVQEGVTVSDAVETVDIHTAIEEFGPDVVHDHSNTAALPSGELRPSVSTYHLNGVPERQTNGIYLSYAQRAAAGSVSAPVIRLPVNPSRYPIQEAKDDYLLFLGRVSAHKGVRESAAFAHAAGLPLTVAGPAWEKDYLKALLADFQRTVRYVGEVGGSARTRLIARARAQLVLSQPWGGPFGGRWIEPGATVVSEAAASGTPVIASDNGCLPEIVPGVGTVLPVGQEITPEDAKRVIASLPTPQAVRETALDRWGHHTIARQYLAVYKRAVSGEVWT
ncbi:glycosyltransferase [Streptomyces sp. ME19-01-6]|uniref:glycosyltransferase n=1 Tax=Streptomyces sp. ME19-01-6 TaxID=3028686 RepID=UPI0029B465DD|nr:glycosyltransferase [Streptomyces sp. ME19-01-6]MDX3224513.1 glycosyltransferase [Streptomyces sp. ME19-01-6]